MTEDRRPTLSLNKAAGSKPASDGERLHKVLAQAGIGSRRSIEARIAEGAVCVNGEVAEVGRVIVSGDRVELDGRAFVATTMTEPSRILIYHKPDGELTTRDDPEGRPTVFDNLPKAAGGRWIAVGRLDYNTTGLLLLTTDGELAHALTHPSNEVEREYLVRVHGELTADALGRLRHGVELDDGMARFETVDELGQGETNGWFRVVVREGRNREVRRLFEAVGCEVSRLKRSRYGSVELPRTLRRGQSSELAEEAVLALRGQLGLEAVPGVMTLRPVIRERRGIVPEAARNSGSPRAWVNGSYADEGRELRRFDNVREEPHGKRPRKPKGNMPDNIGNRAGGPAPGGPGGRKPYKGKRTAPGQDSGKEFKSWYVPEGVDTGSKIAPPRKPRPFNPSAPKPGGPKPGGPGGRGGRGAGGPAAGRGAGKPGGGRGPAGAGGNRRSPAPARGGRKPGGPPKSRGNS